MPDRRPLSIVNGVISELPTADRLGGQLAANAAGQVAIYEQIGSSFLFGTTLADGTTLSVATHGNRRLPVNGGTINLPADASWPNDVTFEFVSVGTTPTIINWTGNAIVSQDTGSLVSQVIGGALTATAIVTKMSSGVAYIYSGTAKGIDAIAVTLGTNPNTPAVGATAVYNFVSAAGLALEGLYRFSGIVGPFKVNAIAGNAVTLENVSATVGASVPAGTKLAPTGIKGDPGAAGAVGTNGTNGTNGTDGINAIAVTTGTNPVTPGVGLTADYVMVSTSGLIVSGTYQFAGVTGTFTLTAIVGNTVTLQNVNATVGATIATGTRLAPAGTPGVAGTSGTSAIATITGTPPVTPAIGATANYTVDSSAGLILLAHYALTNIAGAFQLTNISGTTITLQNINATVGATVTAGMRLGATARPIIEYTPVPWRTNTDLPIANNAISLSTTAQVAGSLRAFHWELRRSVTITAIRQEVTTAVAATTFRLAIYADNGSLYPGAIIANSDTGAFDSGTTGVKLATPAANITLAAGSYFLAINNSGAPTLRTIPVSGLSVALGYLTSGGTNSPITAWTTPLAFGAMPATFPAGATNNNLAAPATMFRTL